MTRSPLASLLFKGLTTKHATVKWTIGNLLNLNHVEQFQHFLFVERDWDEITEVGEMGTEHKITRLQISDFLA